MQVQTIAVWDIEKKVKEKDILLIDLREKKEYDIEHIEGAISIPYDKMITKFESMDKQRLGMDMATKGYTVYTVLGGYLAYKRMKKKENNFRRK